MTEPRFLQLHQIDSAALAVEAIAGLSAPAAAVSPKFFYDALGSRLFDAITELDEYYPTRTEASIFAANRSEIAAAVHALVGPHPSLIDLGAGNGEKAARLFASLRPSRYVAVDISVDFLRRSLESLQRQHPSIEMAGVGLDFSSKLALPPEVSPPRSLVFYPGSSIGNFEPEAALRLLREARALSHGGGLLIGVDLFKAEPLLQAAYDDALGVTSAFNLNLLRHLNRLIGSDFQPRQWRHVARFDTPASRMEMHLEAREALTVRWRGGERRFEEGEWLHTEKSHKWRREEFESLLRDAGYRHVQGWSDERNWFAVLLAS